MMAARWCHAPSRTLGASVGLSQAVSMSSPVELCLDAVAFEPVDGNILQSGFVARSSRGRVCQVPGRGDSWDGC